MRSTLVSAIVIIPSLAAAQSTIANGAVAGDGFVRLPVTAQSTNPTSGLSRRQKSVGLTNARTGTLYTIGLTIGTPGQDVHVVLDTGSAELWVNPNCANAGTASDSAFCATQGRYTASTSGKDLDQSESIIYGIGNVTFEYIEDYVSFGSIKIKNQIFGDGKDSYDVSTGIMGVGPDLTSETNPYPFVIDNLVSQGFTQSRAFSLDLRDIDDPTGSIIFGGIDTKKFAGALAKQHMLDPSAAPDKTNRYWIYMASVELVLPDGSSKKAYTAATGSSGQPVFLDSGGTLTRLPTAVFQVIGDNFPTASYNALAGLYSVDCSVANQEGSIVYGFAGKTIAVSYKDAIWEQPGTSPQACFLGMAAEDDQPVLGDSFLRAAYVVYDFDNRNLHLAQADNCGINLVAIGKGANAVPSVTGGCGAAPSSTSSTPTHSPTSKRSTTTWASKPTSESARPSSSWSGRPTSKGRPTLTSTYTSTKTYTITSCAATVTDCPLRKVTTEEVTLTTTWCPEETESWSAPLTYTDYTTYTVSECPETVTDCPYGKTTVEPITVTVSPAPTNAWDDTWATTVAGTGATAGTKTAPEYVQVTAGAAVLRGAAIGALALPAAAIALL